MRRILPVLLLGLYVSGFGNAIEPGQDRAWETYIRAQKKAHVAFHHLVRMHLHDLRDTIEKSQELQLAVADQQSARFYYVRENYPERITRNQGFTAFVHFPWNEADEASLRQASEDFRDLEKKISKLKEKLDNNAKYDRIRAKLEELAASSESDKIRARFRYVQRDVEEILKTPSFR